MDASKLDLDIRYYCTNNDSRAEGLMHKPPLKSNECAFFIFPYEQMLHFWNKNVKFDIWVIFCDESFRVKSVKMLRAQQSSPVSSEVPCKYVIEVSVENFEKKPNFDSFIKKEDKIVLIKENHSENFENKNFQKMANSIYKSIR